jgi:hypothetical protein
VEIRDEQTVPSARVNISKKKAFVGEDVGECGLQNDGEELPLYAS